jgi:hypothetical protein
MIRDVNEHGGLSWGGWGRGGGRQKIPGGVKRVEVR